MDAKKGQQDDKKAFWKRGVRPSGELGGEGNQTSLLGTRTYTLQVNKAGHFELLLEKIAHLFIC